ncbi:VQ motif-containing protein 25-like [Diospyros lotus]|uniref:VQ motif-containing protein 25-like n=1 Tax=Diospyros lotus TaxID=55363 RepID=UPI0022510C13|nr:VQ motif-containing protein 25-like [Diospyros lotus]
MEGMMMRKQTCVARTTASSALAIHKESGKISKMKPKIRIIHIFAPEIIKTDVANFRELVQRLTGKPAAERDAAKKKNPRNPRKEEPATKKMETGFCSSGFRERIKGEEEIWVGENSSGACGFLAEFAELEGFMQELNNEFPLLPLDASHHVDALDLGETTQLAYS